MERSALRIDLMKLAADETGIVPSMVEELEGGSVEKNPAPKPRWASRFAAVGIKPAPRRWASRFAASGFKHAPRLK